MLKLFEILFKDLVEVVQFDYVKMWEIYVYVMLFMLKVLIISLVFVKVVEFLCFFDFIYVMIGGGFGMVIEMFDFYVYQVGINFGGCIFYVLVMLILLFVLMIIVFIFIWRGICKWLV